MSGPPVALHVAPHPDDELLGAPAMLMALRDAGWRVVNLACGLGRPDDEERRRAELAEACRRAGFELLDDGRSLPHAIESLHPRLVAGPSPHDGHPAHEQAGRAIRDAVEAGGAAARVLFWGLWSDLPFPNVLLTFDAARLAEVQHALAAHAGELDRNRYDRLVRARAEMNAVLGPERVFGFGTRGGADGDYAEIATAVTFDPSNSSWHFEPPRSLGRIRPALPADTAGQPGRPATWWLHMTSVAELRSRADHGAAS